MNCSLHAVQHALAHYDFETFQRQDPRREYPRKTTKSEDKHIERTLKQHSFLPLKDITNIVGLPVSETTIHRRRSEAGLGSYITAQKPGLSEKQMANRLERALRYKDWTVEDWKRVIWSDESSVWMGVNSRRQWVIRPLGERLNPKYVKRTFKSARVKVMVWACFTDERLGPLIVCDRGGSERMNIWISYTTVCFHSSMTCYNLQKIPISSESLTKPLSSSCKIMQKFTKQGK